MLSTIQPNTESRGYNFIVLTEVGMGKMKQRLKGMGWDNNRMLKISKKHNRTSLREHAARQVTIDGQWLEFGVFQGESISYFARHTKKIYGFDSFKGLPEDWNSRFSKGAFATNIPKLASNIELVIGLFQDTLPSFKKEKVAFLHMDADLYSSTIFVLEQLNDYIVSGTIIVFDEYFYKNHEEKATREWIEKYNRKTKIICQTKMQLALIVDS